MSQLNITRLREMLASQPTRAPWRGLEELAETEEFVDFVRHEFPAGADELRDPLTRRTFLKLMAASLGLAGLSACSLRPAEQVVPYVQQPEQVTPGVPRFYATAMPLGGYGVGLLARSNEGRPTKIEGNPAHPASLGATDIFAQASVLALYDPDRSQTVYHQQQASSYDAFRAALRPALEAQRASGGAGLRILTETVTSPTLTAQLQALQAAFPQARRHHYEPDAADNLRAGARQAFGRDVHTYYRFDRARRILALDADFLTFAPGNVRYARDFGARRQVQSPDTIDLNRLYVAESSPSITGAAADHRLPLRAADIAPLARAIARGLGVDAGDAALPAAVPADWVGAVTQDLQQHRGAGIVIAGRSQPPEVHALVHAINAALGNVGETVVYTEPLVADPGPQLESLQALTGAMSAGQVELLLILRANPVYTSPADIDFAAALGKVPLSVHLGLYRDETGQRSQWHIPATHYLESWGDVRAYDGTISIIQPLIMPLYDGKSEHELLDLLAGQAGAAHDLVRGYWQQQRPDNFAAFWLQTLKSGVVAGSAAQPIDVALRPAAPAAPAAPGEGLEVTFGLDPTVWDGRFSNNAWLQEQAKPLTSLTWDNAALLSPADAAGLDLQNGDLVRLSLGGRTVRAPVWIMPGQPAGSVRVSLGYGRGWGGKVGDGHGFDAYQIRAAGGLWFAAGLGVQKLGQAYELAHVQSHFSMEGRDFVRTATLAAYRSDPALGEHPGPQPSLYPSYDYAGTASWGMVIDTTACIGCNACSMACQAENNIAVVGKAQVRLGREMQWIRVDTYFDGDLDNPRVLFQPRPCMHCEDAPCEVVCPVEATVHDYQGLNLMVYNRCVGTRYCSNNCPYKVRRFNFLQYSKVDIPVLMLANNPDVTVRERGVMEKCTYCVQRITAARIASAKEDRPIREGEVVTACQAACPTQAITFGNINDPNSKVSARKALESNYGLLEELGTRPRTSYLPRLSNPNPDMRGAA